MSRDLSYAAFLFLMPVLSGQVPGQINTDGRDIVPVAELSKEDAARSLATKGRLDQTEKDWLALHQAVMQKYSFGQSRYSPDFHILVGIAEPFSYVELTQAETTKVRSTHEAMAQAQKEWNELLVYIIDKYVRAPPSEKNIVVMGSAQMGNVPIRRDRQGLYNFRFTQDCRFIMPRY